MYALPMDLSHTPGFNYALAYWLSCMLYSLVNPPRACSRLKRICAQLAALAVLVGFMTATDGIDVRFFIPCMLLDVAVMLLLIRVSCAVSWMEAAYYCARAFMLGEFAASVEW